MGITLLVMFLNAMAGPDYVQSRKTESCLHRLSFFSILLTQFTPSASPAPGNIVNFTGTIVGTREIQLQWEWSGERNISHFEIQHSTNGRTFTSLAQVKTKFGADAKDPYLFRHANPVNGRNFYRIKTLYQNKTSTYSDIIPLVLEVNNSEEKDVKLYPNPSTNGSVYFSAKGKEVAAYQLFIFDMDAKLIKTVKIITNQTTIIKDLPKGTYMYDIMKDDERISKGQLIIK